MNYYQDITLSLNAEINFFLLRNKIYAKLHKALYDLKANNIGVSFPNMIIGNNQATEKGDITESEKFGIINYKLGNSIRLHSTQESLEELRELNYLDQFTDYCQTSRIKPIPEQIKGYQRYSRKRQAKSQAKLRRLLKYKQLNEEQIKEYKASWYKQGLEYPFVELISISTGQRYRIFIKPSEILDTPAQGEFNQFGLSAHATVPVF